MPLRRIRVLAAVLALVAGGTGMLAGSAVYAQSAGDEQYQDPFAGSGGSGGSRSSGQSGSGSSGSRSSGSSGSSAPSLSSGPPSGGSTRSNPASEPNGTEIPRTGAEIWLTAMLGFGLVLLGAGVRLRLRPEPLS